MDLQGSHRIRHDAILVDAVYAPRTYLQRSDLVPGQARLPDRAPQPQSRTRSCVMGIKVNGRIITEREIARETQYHPADSFEAARRKAGEALVVRELLLQQASRLGIEGEGGRGEARISALIEREVKTPRADEETCRRYYQTHLSR